jgi:cation:H+ antiporter
VISIAFKESLMNILTFVLLIAGLVLLVFGAELLVRGASQIAAIAGLSPLVIGLTIVAYGTSSPEMAVSIQSSWVGQADLALGNIVGSNIFNVLIILGLASLLSPIPVAQQLIRLDVPIMIGVSLLMLVFGLDGTISRVDGSILFLGGVIYTLFLIYQSRKETNEAVQEEYAREYGRRNGQTIRAWGINLGLIGIGLVMLVLGAEWLTSSSITIARALGVSELIIGLTLVAAGTSLPELASSMIATFKGEQDIAVGNVVGSNIFNILAVLGISAIVSPAGVAVSTSAIRLDIPFMIAVAIACLPIFVSGNRITRTEGALFIAYYAIYTVYLILDTTNHAQLPLFSTVMLWFVIPITALTLGIVMVRAIAARRTARQNRAGTD